MWWVCGHATLHFEGTILVLFGWIFSLRLKLLKFFKIISTAQIYGDSNYFLNDTPWLRPSTREESLKGAHVPMAQWPVRTLVISSDSLVPSDLNSTI